MRRRLFLVIASAVLIVGIAGYLGLRAYVYSTAERQLLTSYKNGSETPATYGALYSPLWIDSHGRKLEASVVRAPSQCSMPVALLIFHGRGETISGWAKAQAFLSSQCVSSLVFDYSGFGSSTPPAHIAALNEDASAAYLEFVREFPRGRRCVLGHSMGNAPLLHAYTSFQPRPDCVVIANGFSSVEDMARLSGAPAFFAAILRGVWDNAEAIRSVSAPLMVVHSDADQAIPRVAQANLDRAAPSHAQRKVLHGFEHNALYRKPDLEWWAPVLAFLKSAN